MILQNMNSAEKLRQMDSIIRVIDERIVSYIERNKNDIRRKLKKTEKTSVNRDFSIDSGKWNVTIRISKLSNTAVGFTFSAFQKYFVKYAKEAVSIGAGYYIIEKRFNPVSKTYTKQFIEITPHCINRFKQRCPGMESHTSESIFKIISDDLDNVNSVYDDENSSEKDVRLHNARLFSKYGQYFALLKNDNRFICLTTFVSNQLLKEEQIAYSIVSSNAKHYNEEDMNDNAAAMTEGKDKSVLESMRDDILEKKKQSINMDVIFKYLKQNLLTRRPAAL